jgi:Resolvase, N terminal domain
MIVGHARVPTDGQTLDAQQAALTLAGAERVFAEKVSGAVTDRKALAKAISALGLGDVLLVTKLDRLPHHDSRAREPRADRAAGAARRTTPIPPDRNTTPPEPCGRSQTAADQQSRSTRVPPLPRPAPVAGAGNAMDSGLAPPFPLFPIP